MRLVVATCQFPVGADLRRNRGYVMRQMRGARARGADVAHFPECSLSGYAGVDFASHRGFDWGLLRACTEEVLALAGELGLWVLLGSAHPLSGSHKPHNSLYVIDDRGRIVDRYDKRFCGGDPSGRTGDLAHYSPGDHQSVFSIRGVRCGVQICHDFRYPELYREDRRKGVKLVFHAFHAGNVPPAWLRRHRRELGEHHLGLSGGSTLPEITMPSSMQTAASSNHLFISSSNTSARHSCFPAFFVRPDGVITGRLRRHRAGVLISKVDTRQRLYDFPDAWRQRAMCGRYHSGTLVRDPRSRNRTDL